MMRAVESRLQDVRRLYEILAELERAVGGKRMLDTATGRMAWPHRGVYFFFEPGEERTISGTGPRVVRVGAHALKDGSRTTLWGRLRRHRGNLRGPNPGGGNHRGSVFRHHVGTALIHRDGWPDHVAGQWDAGSSAPKAVWQQEYPLERVVSRHIRQMPFLWLGVDDEPGSESLRGYIERNAIALLSNYQPGVPIDPSSPTWLGRWATSQQVRRSGLWNVNHVADAYAPDFLHVLEENIF